MGRKGVVRPLQGGGSSVCYSSEENVGKRRCRHILSDATTINVRKEKSTKFIDISGTDGDDETIVSIKTNETNIKKYISSLSGGLSKKERANILEALKDMD